MRPIPAPEVIGRLTGADSAPSAGGRCLRCGGRELVEIEGVDGILAFDGRVLDYFQAGGRDASWRVHAAHVNETEVEQRKGVVLFKAYTTKRHYHGALVPDEHTAELEHLRAAVDARRRS